MVSDWRAPQGIDVNVPNAARMYDYYLGGDNNFPADREAAEKVLRVAPWTRVTVLENRAFLGRAVGFLARDRGIRQFVDIGAGLPTQGNVHQIAHRVAPGARVVYVDNDPVVLGHNRALLARVANTAPARAVRRQHRANRPDSHLGVERDDVAARLTRSSRLGKQPWPIQPGTLSRELNRKWDLSQARGSAGGAGCGPAGVLGQGRQDGMG